MKYFIVPIDFSEESLYGLQMAMLFSRKLPVDIRMIHVIVNTDESDHSSVIGKQEEAEEKFRKIVGDYKNRLGKGSTLKYLIKTGRIYQQVVHEARLSEDSVIAASTHGASGFQEFFIGSNTYRIISAADRPVITLRKNACPERIRKIVLPVDITKDTRQKVPFTTEIARLFKAEVHVLGVHTSRSKYNMNKIRAYVSQVIGYVEGQTHSVMHEVFGDNVTDLVLNYAGAVHADLLSITTEQTSGLGLIIGNTAHQILNRAELPVICHTPRNIRMPGTFVTTGG